MWWHFDYKLYETLDVLKLLGLPLVFELLDAQVTGKAGIIKEYQVKGGLVVRQTT